jgi:gentisate 1,2-dioxygenase
MKSIEYNPDVHDEVAQAFVQKLGAHHCQPLWDRYRNLVSQEPISGNASLHWAWQAMQPLIEQAIVATRPEEAERRVLLLTHPGFKGAAATTTNILGGLQILQPGEIAPAHRHTLGALRFVMQGQGAVTLVDGTRCSMQRGDFIVTPNWHWHEHISQGQDRLVWFDCLDLPLVQHLSTIFFEPGGDASKPPAVTQKESRFRFAWADAKAALLGSQVQADGARRFVYPQSWLPALDCHLTQFPAKRQSMMTRSTSSAVMVVVEGEGHSVIGGVTHHWQANDVVSIPHWQWVQHCANSPTDAIVFMVTDKPLLNMLGYFREELQPIVA